jgi:hypothetical protein
MYDFKKWKEDPKFYHQDDVQPETERRSCTPESAGSAYLYDDIEDLFDTCFSKDDITDRDKYIWRMARLKMPNEKDQRQERR